MSTLYPYPGEVTTTTITIRKAENGVIVLVNYPRRLIEAQQPKMSDAIFSALGQVQKKAADDPAGMDPSDIMSAMMSSIQNVQKAEKEEPLRKQVEEYIFRDIDEALAFIRETITTQK